MEAGNQQSLFMEGERERVTERETVCRPMQTALSLPQSSAAQKIPGPGLPLQGSVLAEAWRVTDCRVEDWQACCLRGHRRAAASVSSVVVS